MTDPVFNKLISPKRAELVSEIYYCYHTLLYLSEKTLYPPALLEYIPYSHDIQEENSNPYHILEETHNPLTVSKYVPIHMIY